MDLILTSFPAIRRVPSNPMDNDKVSLSKLPSKLVSFDLIISIPLLIVT